MELYADLPHELSPLDMFDSKDIPMGNKREREIMEANNPGQQEEEDIANKLHDRQAHTGFIPLQQIPLSETGNVQASNGGHWTVP